MFESDFIDFFSRTHWSIVPLLYVPAAIYLFWFGLVRADVSVVASLGLFVGGVLTWSIIEYWLHRTFFHWQPLGRWGERFHFLVHGVHHNWPKDKYRLVMPPAVSISLFWVFFGLFWLALGSRWVWPFHAGFVVGYMSYDVTHYYVHHYNPKTRYGLALKKHHMLHHFKDHSKRFGVSSMLWDYVFGTKS
jgi:sterol desaturase/sphingolipid hydroxylase (fatty acid hydroxylase superfamily)